MPTYKIDLNRDFASVEPPWLVLRSLPNDLQGHSTPEELISKLEIGRQEEFPFQREFALYLLLISSIWPDDEDRLLTAARLFSASLNFNLNNPDEMTIKSGFREIMPAAKVAQFNNLFFSRIGGIPSLLFCRGVHDFHRDLWKEIGELAMVHDVIQYVVKASSLPTKFSSAKFAYHVVAHNIFDRENGYGVKEGPKRKRLRVGMVCTPETVRAKWKNAPRSAVTSFVLTRVCRLHVFDPSNPFFFTHLRSSAATNMAGKLLAGVSSALRKNMAKQNSTLDEWTRQFAKSSEKVRMYRLSQVQLEHVIEIANVVFKQKINALEAERLRKELKEWSFEIPRR